LHSRLFKFMQIFKGANILKTGKRSEGHVLTEKYKNFIFLGFFCFVFCVKIILYTAGRAAFCAKKYKPKMRKSSAGMEFLWNLKE
jgi:hypothetical protein